MRRIALGLLLIGAVSMPSALRGQGAAPQHQPVAPPAELLVAPVAPKTVPDPPTHAGGKPANICRELVAYLETKGAETNTASGPQASQAATSQATSPPLRGTDTPQLQSGLPGPVPPGGTAAKPPQMTLEQARELANANDLRACQDAVRQMRRAGVAMPDSLLALAAMRPDLLEAGRDSP